MNGDILLDAVNDIRDEFVLSAGERLGRLDGGAARRAVILRKRRLRGLLLAAALTALVLTACTVAWLSLEGRLSPTQAPEGHDLALSAREHGTVELSGEGGYLSPYGGGDSPVAQALAEWEDYSFRYEQERDAEWAALHGDGDWRGDTAWYQGDAELEAACKIYGAFDREMADKLFEIRDRWGVELHTAAAIPLNAEDLYRVAGTGDFLLDREGSLFPLRVYEDGSFVCEGQLTAGSGAEQGCSFRLERNSPDCLPAGGLFIHSESSFDQWTWETPRGERLSAACPREQTGLGYSALVFYDGEDWGIALKLGFTGAFGREDVEEAAARFDYKALCTGGDQAESFINAGPTVSTSGGQAADPEEVLTSPELLAALAFSREHSAWVKENSPKLSAYSGGFGYYGGFPSDWEETDALAEELCGTYGLAKAGGAQYIQDNRLIPLELLKPDGDLSRAPEKEEAEAISTPEIYSLLGTESFVSGAEPWIAAAYDNGSFYLEFVQGGSPWRVHYIPKGALYTGLGLPTQPPTDMAWWKYDAAWGGTVSIALDDTVDICGHKGDAYLFYETDAAHVVVVGGSREPRILEAGIDCVDLSKLK